MDVYRTEDEQVEAIKAWWRENGRSAVFGVALGLAAIFGWRSWQAHETAAAEAASVLYQDMLDSARAGRTEAAAKTGEQLAGTYPKSAYAVFARLVQAGLAVDAKDLDSAAGHLQWALDHNAAPALEVEIALRLARVRAAQQEYDAALALLGTTAGAAGEELRGDIEAARGNADAARAAYEKARAGQAGAAAEELLELKLEALGKRADS